MTSYRPIRAALAAGLSCVFALPLSAQPAPAEADIVLTPGRSPQALNRSGSAVTVIRQEDIQKSSPASMADLLQGVPGVSVSQAGGPGQIMNVRLRGAESRNTLVLVDGVRVNDPSAGSGEFDFAALVPADVERIEVLRGPQSALYGSDAIGGVINVITRKGRGDPRGFAQIETGRYGTSAGKAGISGGTRTFDYALSISAVKSAGFSAYGYRVGRARAQQAWPLENDAYARLGGAARFAWRPAEGLEIETGISSNANDAQYDAAFGLRPDTPSRAQTRLTTAFAKVHLDLLEGRLRNSVTLFGNHTDRAYNDAGYFGATARLEWNKYAYFGKRFGAEYQGDLKLDAFGKLIFGARVEEEQLSARAKPIQTAFNVASKLSANQVTRSLFTLYQLPVGDRLDLSAGARLDDIEGGATFHTWRLTGAYRISELGMKMRASAGTGGKAPSLFQTRSQLYGTPSLRPEESFGVDAGIDQSLFGGRALLSATIFHNRLSNLIDFSAIDPTTFTYPTCPTTQRFSGCYVNVAKAEISGLEVSGNAEIIEGLLKLRASYTHMVALDLATRQNLPRRPEHEGRIGLAITPIANLTIEPVVTLVGKRWSNANPDPLLRQVLRPYARVDVLANYQVHQNLDLYVRAENLTDAKYQDVYNYGTTGRALFVGARARW